MKKLKKNDFWIRKSEKKSGFSLIELLVGIAIIITATTVVLSIIVSSFRITNKSSSNQVIRQNGNYAVLQMSRMLQFADSFKGASEDDSPGSYDPICREGTIYHYIKITYNGIDKTISCTDTDENLGGLQTDDGSGYKSLIDRNKISVNGCELTCSQVNAAVGPIIGIRFILGLGDDSTLPEKSASVDFSTTVKMRNL